MFKQLFTRLTVIVVTLFALTQLLIAGTTPDVTGRDLVENEYFNIVVENQDDHITVVSGEAVHLHVGFSFPVEGYVNVSEEDATIYLNTDYHSTEMLGYIMVHEYAHVLQKRLIASLVGGYPENSNPVTALAYYDMLLKLNDELSTYVPDWGENLDKYMEFNATVIPNVERNADCITHALGMWPQEYSYIGWNWCSDEQLGAAYSIINGEWPTAERVAYYVTLLEADILDPYYEDRVVLSPKEPVEKSKDGTMTRSGTSQKKEHVTYSGN